MLRHWILYRVDEGRGFISKRILHTALCMHEMLYGTSYCISYDKVIRVVNPLQYYKEFPL